MARSRSQGRVGSALSTSAPLDGSRTQPHLGHSRVVLGLPGGKSCPTAPSEGLAGAPSPFPHSLQPGVLLEATPGAVLPLSLFIPI